ncbi:MAG: GH92 family glycosyl hydrolase [Kiritimatiellae bacterium]|nr:GH92 family glycosyl hydrolase [Kiritimatiellia bacterium]
MRQRAITFGRAILVSAMLASALADSMKYVDPLIGTGGLGSEYGGMMPYTGVPFGSFQMVPMTRLNRVGQLSFNSADDTLIGFILTRQPAIWMGDWGEVRIPIEPAKIEDAEYTPYLGCVKAGGRMFEYTATAHAVWLRGDLWDVRLLDGYNSNRDDGNLGRRLPNFKGWRCVKHVKDGMQIGVSLISLEQARRNLEAEIGGKSFETVVARTKAEWEKYFCRIEIDAPEDVKTIFYTGLYHTLLYPRQIDEQGRYYSAFDDGVHDGTMYSCYSLWDTYRAEHPWLTLIAPERVDGMMQSLLEMYREGGWLPKWPNPGYTGIMSGAPAEIVLGEAMAKGFTGFDHSLAREAIYKNRTVPQRFDATRRWRDREEYGEYPETRAGLTSYMKRGYVACDETDESVSRTLDFAFADRNKAYTNLWCASSGLFLPKRADGTFDANAKRAYTECRPEAAVWCVPHDPDGLAVLMGGKEVAVRRLDEFFDKLFWQLERGNLSIHGNEPSHHVAYLYNRFGAPEKTQRRVREILTRAYSANRKGFDGNEDCGQMSAWYILSALGFYPLDPVSGYYEIGSPIVRGAKLRLGAPYAPATLDIRVKNYAPNRWRVKRVMLNGVELKDWRISHLSLVRGGVLEFEMS